MAHLDEPHDLGSNLDRASANCCQYLHRATCHRQLRHPGYERGQSVMDLRSTQSSDPADKSGMHGLHEKAANERSSSDSTLCKLNYSLLCEKKQLAVPHISKKNQGCLHFPKSVVGSEA